MSIKQEANYEIRGLEITNDYKRSLLDKVSPSVAKKILKGINQRERRIDGIKTRETKED